MLLKRFFPFIFSISVFGVIISSCNSKSKPESVSDHKAQEYQELATLDTLKITLRSNDKMQFDKDEIVAFNGQIVVLTLEHTGSMPKTTMGHNFVLLDNSISVSAYANRAMKAKENEYIPEDPNLTIAHTKMIGGGESTEIVFKTPQVGVYDFICSFPGHYSIMKGKFIVK